MKTRTFTTVDNKNLHISHRRSAMILSSDESEKDTLRLRFPFDQDTFQQIMAHFQEVAAEAWKEVTPKEANSFGSDYAEYYDRPLDNNGYLTLSECALAIERPMQGETRLFQFNKPKMQSFLFELLQACPSKKTKPRIIPKEEGRMRYQKDNKELPHHLYTELLSVSFDKAEEAPMEGIDLGAIQKAYAPYRDVHEDPVANAICWLVSILQAIRSQTPVTHVDEAASFAEKLLENNPQSTASTP